MVAALKISRKSFQKFPKKKFPELCSQSFLSEAKPEFGQQVCLTARNAAASLEMPLRFAWKWSLLFLVVPVVACLAIYTCYLSP